MTDKIQQKSTCIDLSNYLIEKYDKFLVSATYVLPSSLDYGVTADTRLEFAVEGTEKLKIDSINFLYNHGFSPGRTGQHPFYPFRLYDAPEFIYTRDTEGGPRYRESYIEFFTGEADFSNLGKHRYVSLHGSGRGVINPKDGYITWEDYWLPKPKIIDLKK